MIFNKRSTIRNKCKIPLLMAWNSTENIHEAHASDISQGGMRIEVRYNLSQDITIYIKNISNPDSGYTGNEWDAYIGKVKWIKHKGDLYQTPFQAGIQYMSHSVVLGHTDEFYDCNRCDMCGTPVKRDLHWTDDDLHLCTECFWSIGKLEKSVSRSSLTRFLSGNVL
ncbi:hypothetical protein MTBBW1_1670103 [Desulfamplus magnetovallimortis]|uniref:Uncharacterized protein n=1 Tax=Desulfamplus magnetovallimortis TaxID=1246637 RepID=A0A1W1H9C9_9BACT|nr:PilZ domain-containing protein [Desulfamplus magnetovallimortis]SLM29087.1 hypothetical protein MTBBW1_1670103 [Desulfamplus magnetovallimortis]